MKRQANSLFLNLLLLGGLSILFSESLNAQTGPVKDSLQVNQLKVGMTGRGRIGWIDSSSYKMGISYPANSSGDNYVLYAGMYWIGGYDPSGKLHLSQERFQLDDLYPGPIANNYNANYDSSYQRLWKVDRSSLEAHDQNWWKSGYTTPPVIQNWPAHGDTTNGEAWHLAPFKDLNDNDVYEPQQGDRPIIRGDKAIYFIANDLRKADSTDSPLGVEVHGMIYAFDCPSSNTLENSVMIHYEFINRSNTNYDSLMVGQWSDYDIGCSADDYVGSDVERGIAFGYNGDGYDQACNGVAGYDSLPAATGQVFLKGPELRSNGTDDAWNGPGKGSVNGVGFNDGTVDNEH
ncbi:MAG: hypothetical protein ABEH38_02215, partial [Flavobacteriales bacterium]